MNTPILYDYWRSSACYRVRIALNLLSINFKTIPVNLLANEQKASEHLARNPQGLVPVLDIDGLRLTQSLAIVEYLHETGRNSALLPPDPSGRARVRALACAIASDLHPICNIGPVSHVVTLTNGGDKVRRDWMRKFIGEGLQAFERQLDCADTGRFCHGNQPTMADICLVPQVYNALRWEVDVSALERVNEIAERCALLPAFREAAPTSSS